jgi:hypothetical protein
MRTVVVVMSVFAIFVSASAAVAATAVMRFAWFAGLGELALEVFQAHCGVYMCGGGVGERLDSSQ